MKAVGRAHQPARGARRPRRLRRAVRARPRPLPAARAGQLHRRRRHQDRDRAGRSTGTTRSASTWSRWSSTTWSSCGAEPLFLPDYIATGKVVPERIAAIVAGIAEGCVQAGCALVGGETAEHPGLMGAGRVRLCRHRRRRGRTPTRCSARTGSAPATSLIALGSSGLHSNGYSLVRHVLLEHGRAGAGPPRRPSWRPHARRGAARADPDLRPGLPRAGRGCRRARVRAHHRRRAGRQPGRVLPAGLDAIVDRSTWAPPPVFDLMATTAGRRAELEQTFNLGVGHGRGRSPHEHAQTALAHRCRHGTCRAWPTRARSHPLSRARSQRDSWPGHYQGAAGRLALAVPASRSADRRDPLARRSSSASSSSVADARLGCGESPVSSRCKASRSV